MTLLDYISFMEDRSNIDKYVFIKKEKTVIVQEEYTEEVQNEDGTFTTVTKTRPVENTTCEVFKCTFLEGGGIKKEAMTAEQMSELISQKQNEINQLSSDIELINNI